MLAAILSPESADMWFGCIGESMKMCHVGNYLLELQCRQDIDYRKTQPKIICPCWSLAALFDTLPETIGSYSKMMGYFDDAYICDYIDEDGEGLGNGTMADTLIDAVYEMVLKQNKPK